MPHYIILRGPLGCGKTTIAQKLSKKLGNAIVVHIDDVLKEHDLDRVSETIGCIPPENFVKAQEIVLPEVKEALDLGKIVIFDACFYHKEAIEHLTDSLPFSHYIFTLKAPIDVCITRDKNRAHSYGEGAARAVYNLVSKFDYGVNVDISGTVDEAVESIMANLP
ncbi:AAA family ATPase [Patescibacteria group bacterium]